MVQCEMISDCITYLYLTIFFSYITQCYQENVKKPVKNVFPIFLTTHAFLDSGILKMLKKHKGFISPSYVIRFIRT